MQRASNGRPEGYAISGQETGRPTKYRPEMCDQVIEWGRQGKSRTWVAAELGVDRDTIDNWAKAYPEFFGALARAKALEQQWWEDAGQSGMTLQGFGQSVWSRSMAARFPDDWREKSENTTTLEAGDTFASLLTKLATTPVFPKTDGSDSAE